jgi:energy-coupling factor transporter ATP-binding protein EcfA2
VKPGPNAAATLSRLRQSWRQGEHVVISGDTGSGKTTLARHIDQIRLDNGAHVIVFVCKLQDDETITKDYAGFTRWKRMKKRPRPDEKAILLWPDTSKGKTLKEKRNIQREVFGEAMDILGDTGHWTVHIDEGLYFCHPSYIGLADELAILHAMGRSSHLTLITLMQRPSHLPLIIYSSATHAIIGRSNQASDIKRFSEIGGKMSPKEVSTTIAAQGKYDYLWIPRSADAIPETINLTR